MRKESLPRQINLACQGPITRNNNAVELANHFIPNGSILFSRLQRYDRFLSEMDHTKPFQQIGRSLIYLLPFLKAFGATNQRIKEYSTVHVSLMPGAKIFFDHIRHTIPCFLISAAYEPFILSVCRMAGFQETNTYYTPLNLDQYSINESEREILKDLADEIIKMPLLPCGEKADFTLKEVNVEHIPYSQRLEAIFEEEIPAMQIGKILTQTASQTGIEKVKAITDSLKKTGNSADGVMYIGDSVLDVAAMDWIKRHGGLAVSFNGDREALFVAEIALIGGNSVILTILSDAFSQRGKEGVLELIENWDLKKIHTKKFATYQPLIDQLFSHEPHSFPRLELVTNSNRERLIDESESFRQMNL